MIDSALTDFERRVLDACLAGEHPTLAILRRQAEDIVVTDRRRTEAGAYITFSVADAAPRLETGAWTIDDIDVQVEDVPNGVATILYAFDGRLQFLEFATYEDPWPETPTLVGIGWLRARPIGPETVAFEPVAERDAATIERVLTPRHSEQSASE